jgi:uncharacterized protein YbbC (DUF1343 family)
VTFEPVRFVPKSIANVAMHPKYEGVECRGVLIKITDRNALEPVKTVVSMLTAARKLFPDSLKWRRSINRLAGTTRLCEAIDSGAPPEKIVQMWKGDVERFRMIRSKYLLY